MVDKRNPSGNVTGSRPLGVLTLLLCVILAGVLVQAGLDVEQPPENGLPPVEENMEAAEVSQPVTAVLLNFRGYDTWLEVGVLIAAVLGLLVLHRAHGLTRPRDEETDPVLNTVTRLLVPLMLLLGGFLLWAGTRIPGGAFQAGAILAGAGVLLRVAGLGAGLGRLMTGWPLRVLAVFGFALFLIVGAATLLSGSALLEYPTGWGGELIFLLEAGVMISVGWTLAFVYIAASPPSDLNSQGDEL